MEIRILGNQSVFLKGKKENLLINPTKEILGDSKYSSRIIVFTSEDFDDLKLNTEAIIIRGSGEYEIGGVEIVGYSANGGETVYLINHDGISVAVLGQLKEALTEKRVEKINGIDVLLAPVAIGTENSAKSVLAWAKKWGVNYLIPTGWIENNENLIKFLDVADEEGAEQIESLKVEKGDLPDGLEVKVIKKV
ncbi:MAG: MBL fold metallo-hydrolase [Candidatus Shapirobacteria bacterium]